MRRRLLGARGLNTLTLKNALWYWSPQNPSALTSRRAPSCLLEVRYVSDSPERGCRSSSVDTLGQVSLISCAVRSLISLCLKAGSPPRGQLRARSTVKFLPQTHSAARRGGRQPYRKQRASLNAPLWREKPCSLIDRVVSQLEAPLSLAISTARCRSCDKRGYRLSSNLNCSCRQSDLALDLASS